MDYKLNIEIGDVFQIEQVWQNQQNALTQAIKRLTLGR